MKTYYMDNTKRAYGGELVVITEAAFRKMMDEYKPGWSHHWISGEYKNMEAAKESFRNNWMK